MTDMFISLPLLPLLLVMMLLFCDLLSQSFGPEHGMFILIVFSIGITSWIPNRAHCPGRCVSHQRARIYFVRALGEAWRYRLSSSPYSAECFSPIMVSATLGIANAIITESALSFLELGFPPDFPTWSRLLNDGNEYLQLYPDRAIWLGLAISLTILSINYLSDGLRDALDPRSRDR